MKAWPMFCKVCGRSIESEDKFCSGCGATIAQEPFETAATSGNSPVAAPALGEPRLEPTGPLGERLALPATQQPGTLGSSAASQDLARETPVSPLPAAKPAVPQFRRCPRCRKLNTGSDLTCDWCGTELPADKPVPDPAANIPPPSFAGYAKNDRISVTKEPKFSSADSAPIPIAATSSTARIQRESGPPVLEILVIVLLLVGAGTSVWILRSSLPSKAAGAPPAVVVTISPESAEVVAGKAFDFSATVSGTDDTQVVWTVQEGDAGGRIVSRGAKAKGGGVSSLAVYTAPSTPGTYHLVATSKADPEQSASAEATVTGR